MALALLKAIVADLRRVSRLPVFPLATLALSAGWGYHEDGPIGVFWGWLGWGMLCFVFYAVGDMVARSPKSFDRRW